MWHVAITMHSAIVMHRPPAPGDLAGASPGHGSPEPGPHRDRAIKLVTRSRRGRGHGRVRGAGGEPAPPIARAARATGGEMPHGRALFMSLRLGARHVKAR